MDCLTACLHRTQSCRRLERLYRHGDSGNGMTHGTIAGMLITDSIHGPRLPVGHVSTIRAHHAQGRRHVRQGERQRRRSYTDLFTPGEVDEVSEIAPGHGAIVRRGAMKVAVARALDGTLHERSAVCTHLGCVVQWNSLEQTWDCPCHGSRFGLEGHVLNGPAIGPLAKP